MIKRWLNKFKADRAFRVSLEYHDNGGGFCYYCGRGLTLMACG